LRAGEPAVPRYAEATSDADTAAHGFYNFRSPSEYPDSRPASTFCLPHTLEPSEYDLARVEPLFRLPVRARIERQRRGFASEHGSRDGSDSVAAQLGNVPSYVELRQQRAEFSRLIGVTCNCFFPSFFLSARVRDNRQDFIFQRDSSATLECGEKAYVVCIASHLRKSTI
jgi:hypothetical protein